MTEKKGFWYNSHMQKTRFIGREAELSQLEGLWEKRAPSLVTCRGRRRIGKSTLIEEFARRSGARFVKLEGLRPKEGMPDADERDFFASKLSSQTGCERTTPADWYSAFVRLDREIGKGRTVVLLDEVSWMAHYSLTFPEVLKNAWDDLFKKHDELVFVVCGSGSARGSTRCPSSSRGMGNVSTITDTRQGE